MPRDRDDDSGEYRKPRKSGAGNSVALWVIVGVLGGILLLCGGVTAFGLYVVYAGAKAVENVASSMKKEEESRPTVAGRSWPVEPERKRYTRAEFTKLVTGKTQAEVIQAVGLPDSTQEVGGEPVWYYKGITYDPVTGSTDHDAQLCFEEGIVGRVNY